MVFIMRHNTTYFIHSSMLCELFKLLKPFAISLGNYPYFMGCPFLTLTFRKQMSERERARDRGNNRVSHGAKCWNVITCLVLNMGKSLFHIFIYYVVDLLRKQFNKPHIWKSISALFWHSLQENGVLFFEIYCWKCRFSQCGFCYVDI